MKNETLATMYTAAMKGDDNAIMSFLEAATPVIKGVISRLGLEGQDAEDALQDTFLALVQKIQDGTELTTQSSESFFTLRIQNIAEKAAQNYQRIVIEVPLMEANGETEELDTDYSLADQLNEAIQTLTDREQEILVSRSYGETLESLAKRLNLSAQRVRQIEAKAKVKLRYGRSSRGLKEYLTT